MLKQAQQHILAVAYGAAVAVRNTWWRVRRPLIMGVRVLVIHENMVLLVRHRSGRQPWSLPGGGVERGEPLAAAAARECAEEAGAAVRISHLHGTYDSFALGVTNFIAVFVASLQGELQPVHSFEIAEAGFFPLASLPHGVDQGSVRRITEYQAKKSGGFGKW